MPAWGCRPHAGCASYHACPCCPAQQICQLQKLCLPTALFRMKSHSRQYSTVTSTCMMACDPNTSKDRGYHLSGMCCEQTYALTPRHSATPAMSAVGCPTCPLPSSHRLASTIGKVYPAGSTPPVLMEWMPSLPAEADSTMSLQAGHAGRTCADPSNVPDELPPWDVLEVALHHCGGYAVGIFQHQRCHVQRPCLRAQGAPADGGAPQHWSQAECL